MLHKATSEWIADCYRPNGYYEKRIGDCVEAVWRRSPELAALRNSRLLRLNAGLRYFLQVLGTIVEQGFPLAGAVGGGWLGYRALQPALLANEAATAANSPDPSPSPSPPATLDSAASASESWLAYFPSLPSSLQSAATYTGIWLGDTVNTVLSATLSATSQFIGHSLALSELQRYVVLVTVCTVSALVAYWAGWLLARFLQNLFVLLYKEQQLRQMHETFLQDSRTLIHRTLTDKVRPPLLETLHTLLATTAPDAPPLPFRLKAYAPTYELLRHAIYETLLEDLKELEFAQMLAKSRGTSRYFNGLYYLMRNAEEEIARTLFFFCQDVAAIEGDPVSRFVEQGRLRLRSLTVG